jgi:hypothetical protein
VPQHTVKQGECIMSIAEDHGFLWETIWTHANNSRLKELRGDPNILFPGDIVFVPDRAPRIEPKPTDQHHKFVKKNPPAQVRLRLLDVKRQARPNLEYTATVDANICNGQTDGDGYLTLTVPPNARQLTLRVIEGASTEEYTLPLGFIDPVDELTGNQQRLINLGYACGSELGTPGDLTRAAIRAFQQEKELEITSEFDDATRQALEEMHGS